MVARKRPPVNRARKKSDKKASKTGRKAVVTPKSKKRISKRSNTRITNDKKKRSEAAKKGWAKRKLNEKSSKIKALNKEIKKQDKYKKLLDKFKDAKINAAIRNTKTNRKKLERIAKEVAQTYIDEAKKEGLVETEESKLQNAINEAWFLSQTHPEDLEARMWDIMDEFDISESEAWYLFRMDYEEKAG